MHQYSKGSNTYNMYTVNQGVNITYVSKETREQITCLDEGLSKFTTINFVDASLKTCSYQYSQNYGLSCRHQFAVAYFCGLKSITIDCVDEFWCRIDNTENPLNEINLTSQTIEGTMLRIVECK